MIAQYNTKRDHTWHVSGGVLLSLGEDNPQTPECIYVKATCHDAPLAKSDIGVNEALVRGSHTSRHQPGGLGSTQITFIIIIIILFIFPFNSYKYIIYEKEKRVLIKGGGKCQGRNDGAWD
jgi:hypothetical protein